VNVDRFRPRARWLPFLVPFAVAAAVVALQLRSDDDRPAPIEIAATGPQFATVEELAGASDLIVVAKVDHVSEGRVLTDPANPAAGIRTQLAALTVEQVLKGAPDGAVVLEEEAALLDGSPITVGGASPSPPGERAVYFLIASDDADVPFHALIGPQGRFVIDGDALRTTARDPLSRDLASLGLAGLLRLL
jgi:hypothetical protein